MVKVNFLKDLFTNNIFLIFKSIGLSLMQTFLLLSSSYFIKSFIEGLQRGSDYKELVGQLSLTAGMILGSSVISLAERYITLKVVKKAILKLREDLFGRLLNLPKLEFDKMDKSCMQQLVVQHTERVDVFANAVISAVIPSFIILTTLSSYLFWLNWQLAIITIIIAPILWISTKSFSKPIHSLVERFFSSMDRFNGSVLFALERYNLIKVTSTEEEQKANHANHAKDLLEKSDRMAFLTFLHKTSQDYFIMLSMLLILCFGGYLFTRGSIEAGVLVSFCFILLLMRRSQTTLFGSYQQVVQGLRSLKRIESFLDSPSPNSQNLKEDPFDFQGHLRIDHLSFQYKNESLLRDINLQINPMEITLLTGSNGSGKSTLVFLISGLLKPENGRISIDGIDASKLDLSAFRKQIGIVLQDSHVFDGTILDNICYHVQYTDEQLKTSLRLSTLDDVISVLPDGLNTVIGNGGVNVSRGQAQKIALCRAILRRPRLLILDEPTNHLDDRSINLLLHNLKILKKNCSILIISHNGKLHQVADVSYTLQGGKIEPNYEKSEQETLTY